MSLPSEYTQYDYIQTSGTQILNTGLVFPLSASGNANVEFNHLVLDIELLNTESDQTIIDTASEDSKRYLKYIANDNKFSLQTDTASVSLSNAIPTDRNQIALYTAQFVGGSRAFCVNHEGTVQKAGYNWSRYPSGNIQIGNNASLKIYSVKWMDPAESTKYAEFIPAIRKSDGMAGFYETVGGVFYENEGTGVFIAGNESEPPVVTTLAVSVSSLTAVADAIKTKGGTTATLNFPTEFISAIQAIETGGGSTESLPAAEGSDF